MTPSQEVKVQPTRPPLTVSRTGSPIASGELVMENFVGLCITKILNPMKLGTSRTNMLIT